MNKLKRLEAAERWFARARDEANGVAVPGRFLRWLRDKAFYRFLRSRDNLAEYLFIATLHAAVERSDLDDCAPEATTSNVVPLFDEQRDRPTISTTPARVQVTRRRLVAAAIVSVVVAGGALTSVIRTRRDELIASGHLVRVALYEGVMQAARNTLYRLHPSEHAHTVHLLSGQAAFHVWHDAGVTTRVTAPLGEVRAVAAEFSVLALDALLKVVCAEGSVRVLAAAFGVSEVLHAGQQLTLRRGREAPEIESVNADRELAWLQGEIYFDGEVLEAAAAALNRFNELQIVFSPELASLTVRAHRCPLNDPQRFVTRFVSEQNLNWRRDGKLIRISKRGDASGA